MGDWELGNKWIYYGVFCSMWVLVQNLLTVALEFRKFRHIVYTSIVLINVLCKLELKNMCLSIMKRKWLMGKTHDA